MAQRVSCPSCEKKYAGVVGGEDDGGRLPVILPCLCVFCKACALAEEAKAQQQEDKEEDDMRTESAGRGTSPAAEESDTRDEL